MNITLTTHDGRRLPLEEELVHRRAMIDGTDYVVVRLRGSVEERHYPEGGPIVTRAYTGRDRHTLIR